MKRIQATLDPESWVDHGEERLPAGEPGDRERSVHHDKPMIVATRARKLRTSSTIALPFSLAS